MAACIILTLACAIWSVRADSRSHVHVDEASTSRCALAQARRREKKKAKKKGKKEKQKEKAKEMKKVQAVSETGGDEDEDEDEKDEDGVDGDYNAASSASGGVTPAHGAAARLGIGVAGVNGERTRHACACAEFGVGGSKGSHRAPSSQLSPRLAREEDTEDEENAKVNAKVHGRMAVDGSVGDGSGNNSHDDSAMGGKLRSAHRNGKAKLSAECMSGFGSAGTAGGGAAEVEREKGGLEWLVASGMAAKCDDTALREVWAQLPEVAALHLRDLQLQARRAVHTPRLHTTLPCRSFCSPPAACALT